MKRVRRKKLKSVKARRVKRMPASRGLTRAAGVLKKIKSLVTGDKQAELGLENQIKKISINARRRASYNKASVTIIRNGKIIRISTGKKEYVIGKVQKPRLTVDVTKRLRIK